jgi:ribose transport system permease protein
MFLATIVIAAVVLQRTPRWRRLFFVGQSPQAAELLGIRVRRLKIGSLLVSALLAGLAGLVVVGQSDGGNVTETASYLLPAFAAAFLGTSAITPGRFNAIGTFIATIVLGTATVGLNEAGVPNWTSYVFDGSLLIISLGIFTVIKIRRERSAKAHSMHEAAGEDARHAGKRGVGV